MALIQSPQIVTNGLVFYYDSNNIHKSWRGGPATNYHWNNGSPFGPWCNNGASNVDVTGTSEAGPIVGANTYKFIKTGTASQWNGWEGTYGNTWTGAAGDIWCTSYWYKTSAPAGNTSFGVGSFYLGDWSRAYNTTILANVSSIIPDGEWHYNYTVTRINEAYSGAIIADGPSWGYSSNAGVLYINGLVWNKNAYPTQFIAGTRSNTQSVIDLTGSFTVTSSLNYLLDGSFEFDGVNGNQLTIPYTQTSPNNFSVGAWIYHRSHSTDTNVGDILVMPYNGYNSWIFSLVGSGSFLQLRHHNYNNSSTAYNNYYSTSLSLNQWYYVTATDNGSSVVLYVNGNAVSTISSATATTNGTMTCQIGAWNGASSGTYFDGKIPVVQIYNRALTAAEVKQNFNAQRGRYGI